MSSGDSAFAPLATDTALDKTMANIRHHLGEMESNPSRADLLRLLEELDIADAEHGDVSIGDASGWTLSAHRDGSLVWEDVEADDPAKHLRNQTRDTMLRLVQAVADGDLDEVHRQDWLEGYPRQMQDGIANDDRTAPAS